MNRILKTIRNTSFLHKSCSFNATQKNLPAQIPQFQYKPQFIHKLYGLELQKQVITRQTLRVSEDEYNFYRKVSPNYLVAIIRKVIDDSENIEEEKMISPIDNFYRVCSYCKVQYMPNNVIALKKEHKVSLESLQKFEFEKLDITKPSVGKKDKQSDEKVEQEEGNLPKQQNLTIRDIIKKSEPKSRNQNKYCYFLHVNQIYEPPIEFNQDLDIKYKFLLTNYIEKSKERIQHFTYNFKDINSNMDYFAQMFAYYNKKQDVQEYLDATDPFDKIDVLFKLFQKSIKSEKYYSEIESETKNVLRNKKLYEYYSEMLKVAKQAIDGKKTKQLFIEKSIKNFKSMNPSKEVEKVFNQQVEKYEQMDQNSMEAGVIKTYIEELSKIPYNVQSQQIFDLPFAQKVMNQEHYGMNEVKQSIMQIIAVGKLNKSLKGKIFCFVGGPGLGKTSFAKSVAKALNRKFYNISLGGASDSSVLKGHRRTYVGAYSGKIIQALKNCGTNNPVILLDEIDKMGSSYHGDPRSELLQILDPNQNSTFVDNYVDVPVDLSNVLFITSANYVRNISKPLLDRMETIYLTSYTKGEKIQIFNRHLLKRAIQKTGVQQTQFELKEEVIDKIVQQYSLGEPGVRYLEKTALILLEKVAYKMLTNEEQLPIKITTDNLRSYLGNSYFRRKDHTQIGKGIAISLGGEDFGGRLTYIQSFKKSYISRKEINRGTLFTGSLGDIFKEAMNISYTYARNFLLQKFQNRYLYENQVHVHAPEGAFKKDGSKDSLTIVASLASLALSQKVKPGVAMTGEITLNGQLLGTGGIKQKIIVAKRQRISEIILPIQNEADVKGLSKEMTEGIQFYYVKNFNEAFKLLFPQLAEKI